MKDFFRGVRTGNLSGVSTKATLIQITISALVEKCYSQQEQLDRYTNLESFANIKSSEQAVSVSFSWGIIFKRKIKLKTMPNLKF